MAIRRKRRRKRTTKRVSLTKRETSMLRKLRAFPRNVGLGASSSTEAAVMKSLKAKGLISLRNFGAGGYFATAKKGTGKQ